MQKSRRAALDFRVSKWIMRFCKRCRSAPVLRTPHGRPMAPGEIRLAVNNEYAVSGMSGYASRRCQEYVYDRKSELKLMLSLRFEDLHLSGYALAFFCLRCSRAEPVAVGRRGTEAPRQRRRPPPARWNWSSTAGRVSGPLPGGLSMRLRRRPEARCGCGRRTRGAAACLGRLRRYAAATCSCPERNCMWTWRSKRDWPCRIPGM